MAVPAVIAFAVSVLNAQLTTDDGKSLFAQKLQYYVDELKERNVEMMKLKGEFEKENPDLKPELKAGSQEYRAQAQKCEQIYVSWQAAAQKVQESALYVQSGGMVLQDPSKVVALAGRVRNGEQPALQEADFLKRVSEICARALPAAKS